MASVVAGATGFIARHLVRRLLERGEHVSCLVRRRRVDLTNVDPVLSEAAQPESIQDAVRDVERIYHPAGATLVLSHATYWSVNAEGSRHLAEACARLQDPPTVIYMSSLAAAG